MDVPIGTRFSGDNLNYTVTEKIATGQFRLLCETPGAAGNQYQGNLFPIDYVEGLGAARLADILINGEDEESDEDLLDRYMDSLQAQSYRGPGKPVKSRKKKREFSKIIITIVGAVTLVVSAFTMAVVWKTSDTAPLAYLIPSVFGELATATGFYFSKAKAENRIKLRKLYGPEIYNDTKEV